MTITNGYTDLATTRAMLSISAATATENDAYIELAVEAASRAIDDYCGRRFYASSTDETRYFTAAAPTRVYTDDIISVTSLATDEDGSRAWATTWTTSDYDLLPFNESPYTIVQVTPLGDYSFPRAPKAVKIVGKFGFCALADVPKVVKEACMLYAVRLYKRTKEAPFGVVGSTEMGQSIVIPKLDPDIELLLSDYKRSF